LRAGSLGVCKIGLDSSTTTLKFFYPVYDLKQLLTSLL
jgi:hypothetical protein